MCRLLRKTSYLFTQACRTSYLNKQFNNVDLKYRLPTSNTRTNVPPAISVSHFSNKITDHSKLKWNCTFGSQSWYKHFAAVNGVSPKRFYSVGKPTPSTKRPLKSSRTKQPSRSNLPLMLENEVKHTCYNVIKMLSSLRLDSHYFELDAGSGAGDGRSSAGQCTGVCQTEHRGSVG